MSYKKKIMPSWRCYSKSGIVLFPYNQNEKNCLAKQKLEKQIDADKQNNKKTVELATLSPQLVPSAEPQTEEINSLSGQSCPWVVVDEQHLGELGSQTIRKEFSLDYERLAVDIESGQTVLLFENGKEIFVTYQRESVQGSVICREYEVVTTIKGQPMIDMETVCKSGDQSWQLLTR